MAEIQDHVLIWFFWHSSHSCKILQHSHSHIIRWWCLKSQRVGWFMAEHLASNSCFKSWRNKTILRSVQVIGSMYRVTNSIFLAMNFLVYNNFFWGVEYIKWCQKVIPSLQSGLLLVLLRVLILEISCLQSKHPTYCTSSLTHRLSRLALKISYL